MNDTTLPLYRQQYAAWRARSPRNVLPFVRWLETYRPAAYIRMMRRTS